VDGKELREAVMNKFVRYYSSIYEIRSDRTYRCIAYSDSITLDLYQGEWTEDEPIDDEYSWESIIKGGAVKVIDLKEWMEKNFEKLL
jgi:hypothetical protein